MTTSDLKAIKKVVREKIEAEVKDSTRTIESQIRLSRMQVQNEINELDDGMKNAEIRVDDVAKDVKNIKRNVQKLEKDVEVLIVRSDREETLLNRRVKIIEGHLDLPQEN